MFRSGAGNVVKSPWAKALIAFAAVSVVGAAIGVPLGVILTQTTTTTTAGGKYHSRHNPNSNKNRSLTSFVLSFQ